MLNSFFSVFVNAVCCWMLFDVGLYVSYVYFVYDIIIIIIIIIYAPIGAHPSPNHKPRFDRFSRFCTAITERLYSLQYGPPFPLQTLPLSMVDLDPSDTNKTTKHHASRSVTIGRIYVCIVRRCGLIITPNKTTKHHKIIAWDTYHGGRIL